MKKLLFPLLTLLAAAMAREAHASTVLIKSPTIGSTRSDSSIYSRGLHWNQRSQKLTAVITFTNMDYILQADPRETDTFAFELPGVRLDSVRHEFYATSRNGQRTPVAEFKPALLGEKIELLPGVAIYTHNDHGTISVELVSGQGTSNAHWR